MKVHLLQVPPTADPSNWVKKECVYCGISIYVRISYVKRGQGRFCSISCGTTYRNKTDNPAKNPEVRAKISANHADFSGSKNPMFGVRGPAAPGYIDGRNAFPMAVWHRLKMTKPSVCEECGEVVSGKRLYAHHKDKNRKNNVLNNLQIVCVKCHNNVMHKRQRDTLGRFMKEEVV